MNDKKRVPMILLVALMCLPWGCVSSSVFVNHDMDFGSLNNVAVMPFQNLSGDDAAAERVRDAFMGDLLATEAMYVIPAGEVGRGIGRIGMRTPMTPTSEEIKKFGDVMQVEAVITGVLREYGQVRAGSTVANVISLSLQMIEVQSGNVVWSASSTKGGISVSDRLFGGGGQPMNRITEEVVNELLDKLFQ
jgi:TolB-like protein